MIHVVVSCTERKSVQPQQSMRASDLPRHGFDQRLNSWIENVAAAAPSIRVADLYQGEHWAIVRSLIAGNRSKVWVASAGYGLLDPLALVASYSATFASGHADSVSIEKSRTTVDAERRAWWRALRERVPQSESRSLAELGADGPVVIAASRPYLAAMRDELVEIQNLMPGRLILATTGAVPTELHSVRTAATGALRTLLGGSMQAVSVRLAAKIIQAISENELTATTAGHLTERLMAEASPLERHSRSPLTDGEVSAYIASALDTAKPPSCTALLRRLRDEGKACEQARFRSLYQAAKEER